MDDGGRDDGDHAGRHRRGDVTAVEAAAAMVAAVREASRLLPFGTDPGTFLTLLEELADEPERPARGAAR